jgi:GNAT superfamily N-acetyltransferase
MTGTVTPKVHTLTCLVSAEVHASDRAALLDLFARSSAHTRRARFHHALSVFPQRYLDEILSGRQLALVARDVCHPASDGLVVGLASAAVTAKATAEVAVWVDDLWQRRGVGTLLMQGILGMLADRQINTAVGIVEPGNLAVRRMIERVAPDATMRVEDDVLVVTIPVSGRHAA